MADLINFRVEVDLSINLNENNNYLMIAVFISIRTLRQLI